MIFLSPSDCPFLILPNLISTERTLPNNIITFIPILYSNSSNLNVFHPINSLLRKEERVPDGRERRNLEGKKRRKPSIGPEILYNCDCI